MQWLSTCGVWLQVLVNALKTEILSPRELQRDAGANALPGKGVTHQAP
ncbi:MAG: hypothetical protein RSD57_09545 [Comamonas sp.]